MCLVPDVLEGIERIKRKVEGEVDRSALVREIWEISFILLYVHIWNCQLPHFFMLLIFHYPFSALDIIFIYLFLNTNSNVTATKLIMRF